MPTPADSANDRDAARSRQTLALGLLGALLCYLAHPPVDWSLLAWVGPAPWILLVRKPHLPGRRPYAALWLAGAVFWLAAVQWIRLPHPANIFGLVLLAAYLGAYLPAFVGLSRVAVHRARLPLWLAAPIVWTGLEWLRARLLTGFLMASLAHTQADNLHVIQIADALGEYGVTFLIILVAASIAEALYRLSEPGRPRPRAALPLLPAITALAATLTYGQYRLVNDALAAKTPHDGPVIALIQSDMLADWKGTRERDIAVTEQMVDLSRQAVRESKRPVDLIVWPETMFRVTLHTADGDYRPPAELFQAGVEESFAAATDFLTAMARDLNAAVLVGLDRSHWREPAADAVPAIPGVPPFDEEAFNSAACVDREGQLVGTYDKMHLLPFGEFIPFVGWFPILRNYSPITGGALPGELPEPIVVAGVHYSVSICYETVLPHLIRRQMTHLTARAGRPPDVMVNLTNDAWYWGSSELDMHLASGVFRAVEMRRPLVVAANRGLSAHINPAGRVVAVSERDKPALVLAELRLRPRYRDYQTSFARWGDWFALACLVCCTVFAAIAAHHRWGSTSNNKQ